MRMRFACVVVMGLLLFIGALEARQAASSQRAATAASPGAADVATIEQLMATMIVPTSKVVFEAVSVTEVNGKEQQKAPRTDAEWAAVRNAASKMVEGSRLIAEDGRHVARNFNVKAKEGELSLKEIEVLLAKNRPAWSKFARELGEVAGVAARAAEKKDVDGVFAAAGDLDTACENCHLMFWYPDQDKLFEKKPTKP